jgi:hypothetical protein
VQRSESTLPYCAVAYLDAFSSTYSQYFCQTVAGGMPTLTIDAVATDITTSGPGVTSLRVTSPAVPSPVVPSSPHSNAGIIAGAVVGGVAGLALLVGGVIFFLRRKKKSERKAAVAEVSQM